LSLSLQKAECLRLEKPYGYDLLKLKAAKVGESPPAALLMPIVGPSEETSQAGETKESRSSV
jgi:hypothetical protein